MRKRLQKQIIVILFLLTFVFSQTIITVAADTISSGDYIFCMVLRSCGVVDTFVGQWRTLYENHLKSSGNQTLLNQLKSYDTLSWGAKASGIQSLHKNVNQWLAANPSLLGSSNFISNEMSVNDVMTLPSSSSNAASQLSNIAKPMNLTELTTSLTAGGFDIRYQVSYLVQHLVWMVDSKGGYVTLSVLETETFTGLVGDLPVLKLKNIPYYLPPSKGLNPGKIKITEGCIFTINYDPDPEAVYPYTVEYYKDGELFKSVPKTVPMFGPWKTTPRVVESCEDFCPKYYLPEIESNTPLPYTVSETDNKIKIYYKKDEQATYPYTIKYYKDEELFKTVSGTVPVFGNTTVTSYEDYCPDHYLLDPKSSTAMPYTVSEEANTIEVHYRNEKATYPYTIRYYQEEELFKTVSGTVSIFGNSAVTSYEDYCPEYYFLDDTATTPLPYLVSKENQVIEVHYKKDQTAQYPYTITYYKDNEVFQSVSGTVPVFGNTVITSYEHLCPEYYIVDDTMSTPLPYTVSKEDNVMKVYYEKDLDASYPYVVEYYKDGEVFETLSGTVPVFGDNLVSSCEDLCPQYYLPDNKRSTPLPFQVSKDQNTISIYYKRDLYAAFPYTVEYYQDGELFKTVPGSVSVFDPLVKSCISYCPKGYVLDSSLSTALPYEVSEEGGVVTCYYVKQDTVLPYTVEYYKDGLRMNTYSGNVPVSSPVVQSYPSYCPEYYKMDSGRSDTLPFTVSEGGSRIKVYYKKDEDAVFPYTVECYKNGELVETVSKTVSVFDPSVNEYGYECPEGYVVNTVSSTSLPYKVSKDSHVIRLDYIEKEISLPYTVEYYKDGKEVMTLSGAVAASSPVVESYWPYCPEGYLVDDVASDSLPFVVTESHNVIRVYCIPDPSNPYTSFTGAFNRLISFVFGVLFKSLPGLFFLIMLFVFIGWNFGFMKRVSSHATAKTKNKAGKPKKKRVFTASKSRFMKGVHANKGSSISSKARMRVGDRPGSLKSKANLANWKRY